MSKKGYGPSPVVRDVAAIRTLLTAVGREDLALPDARAALVELARDEAFVDLYLAARMALYEEISIANRRLQSEQPTARPGSARRRRNTPS